ncbi:hypothetical protein ADICYQ_0793 [Cyclobacterium qasimii M12-11B]|uniref:Uncharacterized protein n=1 Tax=Cyclobacterium qasimii M12-11B TaxID=641524 RepID=S7WW23_9BACT|nr:hypothetical protein ADICYQ_0793 [Cyclobacterium qasimii M12-11B]
MPERINASGKFFPAISAPKPKIEKILAPIIVPTAIEITSIKLSFLVFFMVYLFKL